MDKDVDFSTVLTMGRKKTKASELIGFLQKVPHLEHELSKQKLSEAIPDMSWHE